MNKKTAVQLSLVLIIILIFLTIFLKYFNQKTEVKKKKFTDEKISELSKENSNTINNINYSSKDNVGNTYTINAITGKINSDNSDIILLKNVEAKISIVGSEDVIIYSDFAEYNSKNYDTNFYKNIKVEYTEHKINCEYLDLLFKENLAILYEDIVYKNSQIKLLADRLEIDLITKNSKLSMKNKKEKIEIIYKK